MKEKARSAIYIMAGCYLILLDYSMIKDLPQSSGGERLLMMVFSFVFGVMSIGLMGFGVYLYRKSYIRGKKGEGKSNS